MNTEGHKTDTPAIPRGAMWLILAAVATGAFVAGHLVWIKLRLEFDPSYVSSCNFSAQFNCDAVQTSKYASVLGYPLALYGLATYIFFGFLAVLGRNPGTLGRGFHGLLAAISVVGCIHSAYLAYISSVVIGAYCIFCMVMYTVTGIVAGASTYFVFQQSGFSGTLRRIIQAPASMAGAAVIYALILGASIPIYNQVRGTVKAERMAEVREEIAQRTEKQEKPNEEMRSLKHL